MPDNISITPLYGLKPYEPLCYLLEFSGCRMLLDCGWDYLFLDQDITNLKKIGCVDCILISHSTIHHIGALPYAVAKLGITCPVYATLPTLKMGLMVLYDAFQSMKERRPDFSLFSIEDVDYAFNLFSPLKFYEKFRLQGNWDGITITPVNAGNVLGGTIWKISKESDDIYYCVDFNHKVERHLAGSHIEIISRPSMLIADCINFDKRHNIRIERDADLIKSVTSCLLKGGECLIPVDSAGRCLEILLVLHSHWKLNNLVKRFSLVFLSHTAKHTIDFANTFVEWTSESCQKNFNKNKRKPFDFEFLRICTKMSDLDFIPKPRVILATNPYLENGFSHKIFLTMSKDPKNLIILTQRVNEKTIAGKLLSQPINKILEYTTTETEYLKDEELEEFIQFKKEERLEKRNSSLKSLDKNDTVTIVEKNIIFNKKSGNKKKFATKKITQIYPMYCAYENSFDNGDEYGQFVNYKKFFDEKDSKNYFDVESVEFPKDKNWNKESSIINNVNRQNEHPTKTVTRVYSIEINCSVKYIDFEGRSDGSSIFNIISKICPRKLLLLHGSAKNANTMKKKLIHACESITAPKISMKIDVTFQSKYLKVKLDEKLINSVKFSKNICGYKFALVTGLMTKNNIRKVKNMEKVLSIYSDNRIFIGTPKLINLKKILLKKNIETKIEKREIVAKINKLELSIKKLTPKDMLISGSLSNEYFDIRKELYKMITSV